jgi:hypothetical protein
VPDSHAPSLRTASAGVLLVVAGIALWVLYRYQSGRQPDSFTTGGAPPSYVHVTSGKTYWLSIAGGVQKETSLGLDPAALKCTAATPGAGATGLAIQAESADTKAINQIASFVAPSTGKLHIECRALGTVYVDDADGTFDYASLWLVLATIALVLGIPLALSPVVLAPRRPASQPVAENDPDLAAEEIALGSERP